MHAAIGDGSLGFARDDGVESSRWPVVGSLCAFDVSEPSAYAFFLEEGGRRPDDGRALSFSARVAQTLNASRLPITDHRLLCR